MLGIIITMSLTILVMFFTTMYYRGELLFKREVDKEWYKVMSRLRTNYDHLRLYGETYHEMIRREAFQKGEKCNCTDKGEYCKYCLLEHMPQVEKDMLLDLAEIKPQGEYNEFVEPSN